MKINKFIREFFKGFLIGIIAMIILVIISATIIGTIVGINLFYQNLIGLQGIYLGFANIITFCIVGFSVFYALWEGK